MAFLNDVPKVTRNLIIINIIVFLFTMLNRNFMTEAFALFYPTSPYFHWWQYLTHMFMHGGFWHIFFNMFFKYLSSFFYLISCSITNKTFIFNIFFNFSTFYLVMLCLNVYIAVKFAFKLGF